MKRNIIVLLVLSCIGLCSCSSKQTPIDDLASLAEELTENGEEYTDEDWETAASEYAAIEEELQEYHYTNEEHKKIGKLKGRIFYLISSKYAKNKINQFANELSGVMEELNDSIDMSNELKDLFDE